MESKSKFIMFDDKDVLRSVRPQTPHMNWDSVYKASFINRIVMILALCKELTILCAEKYPYDLKTCEFF